MQSARAPSSMLGQPSAVQARAQLLNHRPHSSAAAFHLHACCLLRGAQLRTTQQRPAAERALRVGLPHSATLVPAARFRPGISHRRVIWAHCRAHNVLLAKKLVMAYNFCCAPRHFPLTPAAQPLFPPPSPVIYNVRHLPRPHRAPC